MQTETTRETSVTSSRADATSDNIGIWDGYLSSGPVDLPTSGTASGTLHSGEKGRLTVDYNDRSFTYQAADGTITTGKIDKTFSLTGAENTTLGGGTLAFTDEQGQLWFFCQNAAQANSRWTYYNVGGGTLNVVATDPGHGGVSVIGTASSDLWFNEQKYAVQPPPVGIIKWSAYLSGGPILLSGGRQSGQLANGQSGTFFVDYPNRSFTYENADGTQTTGLIEKTFAIGGGGDMSLGATILAFVDDKGQLWIFTENSPGTNARWTYIPAAGGDALNLVSKTASGNAYVQTSGRETTDLWYDMRRYGTEVSEICYLTGTLIATPTGEKAVENLSPGDEILVMREGEIIAEKIIWVGTGFCSARGSRHRDLCGHPVRIHAGALGQNVPSVDLLVTSEHSLYLDGALVPARMLVNDRTITYENARVSYHYHHIELETHGLIFANGALSESYLDTGNRFIFREQAWASDITPSKRIARSWNNDSAAPLRTDRAFVEPLWRKLAAGAACSPSPADGIAMSENIFLESQDGHKLPYVRKTDDGYVFKVEAASQALYLRSATHRPCDVIGPFIDDRRELGLQVRGIKIFTPQTCFDIDPNSISQGRDGWHSVEASAPRWTKGRALIPLSESICAEPVVIVVSATAHSAEQGALQRV